PTCTSMSTPRETIVSAARGDQPMDLVVRNVDLVNVFTAEIYKADLGIKGDRYSAVARYQDGKPAFELQGFRDVDGTGKVALPGLVGIAESMDYPGVINHHARMAGIVQVGLDRMVVNEGHAPRVSGRWLQAYLAAGVTSDHESRWWEEILEKLRAGMVIHIRDSSFGHYVGEAARAWEQVPHAINLT